MDDLKQHIVEKVLTQIDPDTFLRDVSGVELGQRQGQMALVQQLVKAFAAILAEEDVELSASQEQALLGEVVADVMAYRPKLEVARTLDIKPTAQRLVRRGTWNTALVNYLRACTETGRSVLVSGEHGAGKSTLLSVIATLAPDARVVTLEESAQLEIDHPHVVRLQGEDRFEAASLLAADWLVIDELAPETALAVSQAMTAVPILAAIRGGTARSALGRLVDWILDAAPGLSEETVARLVADHVNVIVNVERQYEGAHHVTELVEVLPDPSSDVGLRVETLLARDRDGELAWTGVESAFVKGAFLQRLPQVEPPPPEAIAAPPVEMAAAPMPMESEPAVETAPPAPEPEKKGFFARLFGGGGPKGPTLETAVSAAARGAAIAATTDMTDFEAAGAPPIVQKMTAYLQGDDLFDMSYAIEEGEEFLGEMGVGLAETVGEGTPKRVTGFEVWMFDKVTLETPAGTVLSEGAYADPDVRGKYGQVIAAAPGERIVLDTGPLRLEARVKEVALDAEGLAFERMTIELAAWHGKGTG